MRVGSEMGNGLSQIRQRYPCLWASTVSPRRQGLASEVQVGLQPLLPGYLCVGHSSLTLSNPSCKSWKVFEQHGINVGLIWGL